MSERLAEPAFAMPSGPEPRINHATHYNEGLSIREYFAARAPAEPMNWFEPRMPEPRPLELPAIPEKRPETHLQALEYMNAKQRRRAEIDTWDRLAERERLTQWPWAWADAVLARA